MDETACHFYVEKYLISESSMYFFDTSHFPVYSRDTDALSLSVVIKGSLLSRDYKAEV